MSQILIIEDEAVIRKALKRFLTRHDHQVDEADSIECIHAFDQYDLIISDLRLPGKPGTEIMQLAPHVPIIIMTSYASVSSAVTAMKMGATDYIAKPFDHDELLLIINKVLGGETSDHRPGTKPQQSVSSPRIKNIIGKSHAMQDVFKRIEKVAPTDATVLIIGESGTGKELVARALHQNSGRANAPFVAFNCAAAPEQTLENDLFGQHPQVGLIEQAAGGVLFLDEIGELPITAQARLLRILQQNQPTTDKNHDVRILAATQQDMRHLVQNHQFRSDLYFRLRVVEIQLPPLCEREDDVIELAVYLLQSILSQLNRPPINFTREALLAIRRYRWPGNVRELANTIERAVILCEGKTITPDLLAIDHRVHSQPGGAIDVNEKLSLEEYFRVFVLENQGKMTETELAQALGISRKTLWERRQRFGLPRKTTHKNTK